MADDDASLRVQLLARMGELRGLAHKLAHGDEADDVVQDTAVVALSQRAEPTSVAAWLRQVLRNGVRGRVRHRGAWDHRRFDPPPPEIPDSPEDHAATLELFALVHAALDDLEEPYRTTLRRRFFEGLSPASIAREGAESPATVRWRVHEGLRRMRARLDDRCGGRERWCGALVLAFDPFARPTEGASPMMHTSLTVSLLAASTIALVAGVTFALQSHADDDPRLGASSAATSPSAIAESDGADTARLAALTSARFEPASCNPEPETHDDDAPALSPERRRTVDVVIDCLDAAPDRSLDGLGRLEIDITLAAGTVGELALVETVHATTGRKMPCTDGVMDASPLDAPDVVRHREIEECMMRSIQQSDATDVEPGGTFGFVLLLDGKGDVAPETDESAWALPELPEEPVPDPNGAVAALGLPTRGSVADDRIEVVACGGYGCSYSRKGDAQLEELALREPRLAVAWLQSPLPMHADGLLTASAAVAASRQGRFWEMHRALFEHDKPMDRDDALALATTLGLDTARFAADLDDPATAVEVGRQHRVCEAAGVNATPSFFVDGDLVRGAIGADALAQTIEELAALDD